MTEMADADPETSWREIARHDVVMATIRDFTERSGAVHVAVLLDLGEGREPPLLECEPGDPLTISREDENFVMPPGALTGVTPLALNLPKPLPASALDVDAERGQVAAPIGAVDALARAVGDLARVLGGRTVAMADFQTRSGEALTIAAREGEPVVLTMNEHQFELPETRPGASKDES